jgi:hypothetical protein
VAELSSNVAQLLRRVARITGAPGGALTETERALAAAQVDGAALQLMLVSLPQFSVKHMQVLTD